MTQCECASPKKLRDLRVLRGEALQNLSLTLDCSFRIVFVRFGNPNCGLPTMALTLEYVTVLRTFNASMRQSSVKRSPNRNARESEPFSVNCFGPMIEFRPAVPHCPARGAA